MLPMFSLTISFRPRAGMYLKKIIKCQTADPITGQAAHVDEPAVLLNGGHDLDMVAVAVVQAADDPPVFVQGQHETVRARTGPHDARQAGHQVLDPGMRMNAIEKILAHREHRQPEGPPTVSGNTVRETRQVIGPDFVLPPAGSTTLPV